MSEISNEDKEYVKLAIEQARLSVKEGGFPAGSVIVKDGHIIAKGISIGNLLHDPTAHAESASIREACKSLETSDLSGTTLYGSLQPCLMCFASAGWANVSRVVFAVARDTVNPEYYNNNLSIKDLNDHNLRKIEVIHCEEFQNESLEVVKEWESKL